MNNKNLMIGLGVLAVAGIAYYMYKKPKATTTTSSKTAEETKASATGIPKIRTVRNPTSTDLLKPCGGATVQGHYRCCNRNGFQGYSLYSSCENLVAELPKEG